MLYPQNIDISIHWTSSLRTRFQFRSAKEIRIANRALTTWRTSLMRGDAVVNVRHCREENCGRDWRPACRRVKGSILEAIPADKRSRQLSEGRWMVQTQTMALLAAVWCLKAMLAVDVEVGDGRLSKKHGRRFLSQPISVRRIEIQQHLHFFCCCKE